MKLIHLSDLHIGKRVNEVSMPSAEAVTLEDCWGSVHAWLKSLFALHNRMLCIEVRPCAGSINHFCFH